MIAGSHHNAVVGALLPDQRDDAGAIDVRDEWCCLIERAAGGPPPGGARGSTQIGILHYDRDDDVIGVPPELRFASEWLAPAGSL